MNVDGGFKVNTCLRVIWFSSMQLFDVFFLVHFCLCVLWAAHAFGLSEPDFHICPIYAEGSDRQFLGHSPDWKVRIKLAWKSRYNTNQVLCVFPLYKTALSPPVLLCSRVFTGLELSQCITAARCCLYTLWEGSVSTKHQMIDGNVRKADKQ